MGLHKSFDRQFVLVGGAVMTNGGSLDLSRGEIGIFDTDNVTENGAIAVSSFKGMPKNKLFEFRYRETDEVTSSRSKSSKTYKSFPFSLEDVLEVRVSTPKRTEAVVDEVVVGWNGIDPSTSLKFNKGEKRNAAIELSGEAIGLLGYPNATVTVPMFFDAGDLKYDEGIDECIDEDPCGTVDCTKVVENAIEVFKQFKLRGSVPVTDYVEITPIRSCTQPEVETPYTFYQLTLCDTGDASALSLVRQQYTGLHVERVKREGAISTYELLQPSSAGAPENFKQSLPSLIKGCKDCPSGYTATESGFVYAISIEDDGVDKTSVVESLPNYVSGTALKADGQENGVGFYTVVLSKKLTLQEVKDFVDANVTSTVEYVNTVDAVCKNPTITEISWKVGSQLNLTEREFYIDLPDLNCEGLTDRLEELQIAYPQLTIQLEGTKGGCQTRYKTKVKTNLRGPVCDPIFLDAYKAETPLPYDNRSWKAVETTTSNSSCLCGFKLKGKLMQIFPTECVVDDLAFVEDSVKIRVSGGWISEVREGIGRIEDKPFNVEYITFAQKRTHLGYGLVNFENQSRTHFSGNVNIKYSNMQKFLHGVRTNIDYEAQYVDYAVILRRNQFAQGMSQTHNQTTTFHIQVEVGRQEKIEELLNSLAAQAGIKGVKAFG